MHFIKRIILLAVIRLKFGSAWFLRQGISLLHHQCCCCQDYTNKIKQNIKPVQVKTKSHHCLALRKTTHCWIQTSSFTRHGNPHQKHICNHTHIYVYIYHIHVRFITLLLHDHIITTDALHQTNNITYNNKVKVWFSLIPSPRYFAPSSPMLLLSRLYKKH